MSGEQVPIPRKGHALNMKLLNMYSTKYCETDIPHDYNHCLLWHPKMSPFFSDEEVRYNHLRRVPIIDKGNGKELTYLNEKCLYGGGKTCPQGDQCDKCHNEKEYMYHPLVYMTTECRHYRSHACQNRVCAFYHSERQRKEAEDNRNKLVSELEETKRIKDENAANATAASIGVDINSSNHFPSLVEVEGSSKGELSPQRKYSADLSPQMLSPSSSPPSMDSSTSFLNPSTIEHTSPLLHSLQVDSAFSPLSFAPSPNFTPSIDIGSSLSSSTMSRASEFGFGNVGGEANANSFGFSSLSLGGSGGGTPSPFFSPHMKFGGNEFEFPLGNTGAAATYPFSSDIKIINDQLKLKVKPLVSMYHYNIYEGIWNENGEERRVRVKELNLSCVDDRIRASNYVQKVHYLYHCNLIRFRSVIYWGECAALIVTDFHEETLLSFCVQHHDALRNNGKLSVLCRSFILQLCSVMKYLHQEKLVHRNLRPSNIYIVRNESDPNHHRLVLGDFEYSHQNNQPNDIWDAPEESVRQVHEIVQSDMYRVGILLFYMIAGKEPDYNVQQYGYPSFERGLCWFSLIAMLLQGDYQKRLTAEKIADHPVFWNSSPTKIFRFLSLSLKLQPNLTPLCNSFSPTEWFGRSSWKNGFPRELSDVIPNYASYDGASVPDLISVIMCSLKQVQSKSSDPNGKMEQLRKRALALLTTPPRHPILYFCELFPRLVFVLWRLFFMRKQEAKLKSDTLTNMLAVQADLTI